MKTNKFDIISASKFSVFVKIFCYLIIFTGMGLILPSCSTGYVATEPGYGREYARPLPPNESYIWINGNWRWDRRAHIYVYDNGYWVRPRHGHVYREGRWETDPRGKWWRKGYWEKERNDNAYSRERKRDRGKARLNENRR
jgi:hypothetical protein